jgi:hypothetical protein
MQPPSLRGYKVSRKYMPLCVALAFLAALASDSLGQSPEAPRQNAQTPEQQSKEKNQPPARPSAIVKQPAAEQAEKKPERDYRERMEKWFEGWSLSDKIAGIASFVAFLQFWALFFTLRIMRSTAQRQLRAYISFTPQVLMNAYPQRKPIAKFKIKNTGQTPAYNIRYITTLEILPHPMVDHQGDLVSPGHEPTPIAGRPIHSQEHIDGEAHAENPLTFEDFQRMNGPDHRLYLAGIVWYEDIFGVTRKTKFCVYIGGPEFADIATAAHVSGQPVQSLDWSFSHVHNEAT